MNEYNQNNITVFEILKSEIKPTIIVIPDAIALCESAHTDLYAPTLDHCNETPSRVTIFDVRQSDFQYYELSNVEGFRTNIGTRLLYYGAAYYPRLNTNHDSDIDFINIDSYDTMIAGLLEFIVSTGWAMDPAASKVLYLFKKLIADNLLVVPFAHGNQLLRSAKKSIVHQNFKEASPTSDLLIDKILNLINILPPSGTMAGIYSFTDNDRGV